MLFPTLSFAQFYKCKIDGRIVITDRACKDGKEVSIKVPPALKQGGSGVSVEKRAEVDAMVKTRLINEDIDRNRSRANILRRDYERSVADLKSRMPVGESVAASSSRNAIASEITSIGQEYDRMLKALDDERDDLVSQRKLIANK